MKNWGVGRGEGINIDALYNGKNQKSKIDDFCFLDSLVELSFHDSTFFFMFSFPFLSIFLFKFVYRLLFGGYCRCDGFVAAVAGALACEIVILCALKCIYGDQKLLYRFELNENYGCHNSCLCEHLCRWIWTS